jgi:hypothetical protein
MALLRRDSIVQQSTELAGLMRTAIEAIASGDIGWFRDHVSRDQGMLAIGTDPAEWWTGYDTFLPALDAQLAEMGGSFPVAPGGPVGYVDGAVGWTADRAVLRRPDSQPKPLRLTSVWRQEGGDWKIVQWHASLGVGNQDALGQELTV